MAGYSKLALALIFFVLLAINLLAQPANEKNLMKKAKELTYEGQLQHAKDLMAKEDKGEGKQAVQNDEWDGNVLFLAMFWGAIGAGFFLYGKRQGHALFLLCGIGLMAFPYFTSSITVSIISGVVLCVLPFKVSI